MLQLNLCIWWWSSSPLLFYYSSTFCVVVFESSSCSICSGSQSSLGCISLFQIFSLNGCSASSFALLGATAASTASIQPTRGNKCKSNGTSTSEDGRLCVIFLDINIISCAEDGDLFSIWNWTNWLEWLDWLKWFYWFRFNWFNWFYRHHNWRFNNRGNNYLSRRLILFAILLVKQSCYPTSISLWVWWSARIATGRLRTKRE